MTFAQVVASLRVIAGGEYIRVSVEYTEHGDGQGSVEWQVYVHGFGFFASPDPEVALEKMRQAMNPGAVESISLESVGTVEVK